MKSVFNIKLKKVFFVTACLLALVVFLFKLEVKTKAETPAGLKSNLSTSAYEPRGAAAMTAFDRLPFLKKGTTVHQASSYDRAGANYDVEYYHYRNPATGGYVVLEENKPGTIYRMWITGFGEGNVRVYFDGEATPRIDKPVPEFFSGTSAPFLSPLTGYSSGGYYSYYPLSFRTGVRVEFTSLPRYYNMTYHLYSTADGVTTYTGTEDMSAVYSAWNNPTADPKDPTGNQTISIPAFNLAPGQTQSLLNYTGQGSIRQFKLQFPQFITTQQIGGPAGQQVTDNGKAFVGSATYHVAIEPTNAGAVLTRRYDHGIADQVADVYVDNQLVGRWTNAGADTLNRWRDDSFTIPQSFTQGKSTIQVKIQFISSQIDWNEFYYWVKTIRPDNTQVQTDTLDVGNTTSEQAHGYTVVSLNWSGSNTFTYPAAGPGGYDAATFDILSNTRVKMYWDGEATPSVDLPLGFLFGVGSSGEGTVSSLMAGTIPDQHLYYNYFPMPFNQSARIELVNNSQTTIQGASGTIQQNPAAYQGVGDDVGYFTTFYNQQNPTVYGTDFNFATIPSGKGHIVGWVENLSQGNVWGLEGDERIFIDDLTTNPRIHGTGTEDIYNSGYYFADGIVTKPIHGAPLIHSFAGSLHYAMYRWALGDVLPFEKSLKFNVEHGATNDYNGNYEGAVFAYMVKNQESLQLSDTLNVGDAASELAHNYTITNPTWQGSNNYGFVGRDDGATYNGTGRAHTGTSQFTLAIDPNNSGVRLAKIFDIGIGNQKAQVFVDNQPAGTWFSAGKNTTYRASLDIFEIPPDLTLGKSSITVKIQFVSSDMDWNEYQYKAYSHVYSTVITPTPTSLTPTPTNTPTPTATSTPTPTPTPVFSNTGNLNPSANAAATGGDGNGYQTNPANGYTNNSSFAVDTNSGTNTSTSCTDAGKDKHNYYNYGFTIPSGTTIRGIEVRLDARVDNTSGAPKICVQMSYDGGFSWTTAKSTPTLTTSEATYLLGSSVDTWGRSWTNTQFSNANFRIRVINVASNTSRDFSLDWISPKVYYSTP